MSFFVVTLDKLTVSQKNVRKTGADQIDDLLASIPGHGLINGLTVEPSNRKGHFEVIAGGRRLRALQQLSKEQVIAARYPVPCHLYEGDDSEGVSLAENYIRLPMAYADQYDSFKQQADAGKSIGQIADAFGVSETVVRQRLKLARVAPLVFEAFRNDEIGQKEIMAYALSDDQARQEALFRSNPNMREWQIKQALTANDIPSTDKRVRLVGLETYRAAGGSVYQDLFSDDDDDVFYLTDPALLDRLCAETLAAKVAEIKAEGWKEVIIETEGYSHTLYERFPGRIYAKARELTAEEEAELERLEDAHDALAAEAEAEPDNEDALAAYEEVSRRIDALTVETFDASEMAEACAVVSLSYNGELRVSRGLTTKNHSNGFAHPAKATTDAAGHPVVSVKLQTELDAVRTAVIASDLAGNPAVALAATVHAMARSLLSRYSRDSACVISVERANTTGQIAKPETIRPLLALEERLATMQERAPSDPKALWQHYLSMDREQLLEHLALFTALSLNAFEVYGEERRQHADQLAEALGSDPGQAVQLAEIGYFERTAKKHILSVLKKEIGKDCADNLAGLKKAELAQRATEKLDGKWLPAALRQSAVSAAESEVAAIAVDTAIAPDDGEAAYAIAAE